MVMCVGQVGELLEDREKYRSAIAWYKRCCSYSANGKRGVLAQAGDLCNLGLAQKRASQWKDSLASYDECLRLIAGACGYNRPCAHQYVGKSQSCML